MIQEPDGNFPPDMNPLTNRHTQIDWPRLAFTAWALALLEEYRLGGFQGTSAGRLWWP